MQSSPVGAFVGRVAICAVGLALFGIGIALVFAAELGRAPWDVLHEGIAERSGLAVGTVIIVAGIALMVLWIPLRERPGLGTVMNAVLIGLVFDLVEPRLPDSEALVVRGALLVGGIAVVGIGTAVYLRPRLGPGPRDGLMTGLARVTPLSVRAARTIVEASALVAGVALGGEIGVGTLAFALGIGPAVQWALFLLPSPDPAVIQPSTEAQSSMECPETGHSILD